MTGSGPRVLWGYTRQVQGSIGSSATQPSRPRGSTLTFQLHIGVPWVQGLRHGVTMHPRGRHLREGRIPWSHGKSHNPVREQLPQQTTQQHNHYYQYNHNYHGRECYEDEVKTWDGNKWSTAGRCWTIANEKDRRRQRNNYHRFPLRGVNQMSSTASVGWEPGESNLEIGPTARVPNRQCKSWLSPYGTRSNSVSQYCDWSTPRR